MEKNLVQGCESSDINLISDFYIASSQNPISDF